MATEPVDSAEQRKRQLRAKTVIGFGVLFLMLGFGLLVPTLEPSSPYGYWFIRITRIHSPWIGIVILALGGAFAIVGGVMAFAARRR